MINSETFT